MLSDERPVRVHSVAEAYLYLKVGCCDVCGKGPLEQNGNLTKTSAAPGSWSLATRCPSCEQEGEISFEIDPPPTRAQARSDRINPTSQRSEAIDLLGWLALFQSILAAAEREPDKETARQLTLEAAQCLDEALKFYDGENELPPADAFFAEASRRRFHDHPQQFARSKWLERRLRLPEAAVTTRPADPPDRRRWWRFWHLGRK